MTRIDGPWLGRPDTEAVFRAIEGAGHRAWFVGGCVRDALAGREVSDVDIATDARPQTVLALAGAAGLEAVPTGLDHGTVTLVSGGHVHEVTTLRRDVETDGRRAVVAFADTIEQDAARRDLTVNALYATRAGEVLDPTGRGVADLRAGRIRFIGDARERIREDFLRILRYFRFLASHGDPDSGPHPEALAAIGATLDGLGKVSAERIGHEMRKLLSAPDPGTAVATMTACGVLARILPGADPRLLGPLIHLEAAAGCAPSWLRRLAALGGEDAAARLRLSRAEARSLAQLRDVIGSATPIHEIAYRHGREAGADAVLLRAALAGHPAEPADLECVTFGAAARFPVSAADLMPALQGEALGNRLRVLEDRWIESRFTLTRNDLLDR